MTVWHKTAEYKLIYEYYRDRSAKRSGVPLIRHIQEGVKLLIKWNRSDLEIRAFCLHPLVQENVLQTGFLIADDSAGIPMDSMKLATEYANIANKYLCKPETDQITMCGPGILKDHLGVYSESVAWMLLADKVQNQEDFRRYHWFTHPRAKWLEKYFDLWIKTLRFYIGAI